MIPNLTHSFRVLGKLFERTVARERILKEDNKVTERDNQREFDIRVYT